MAEYNLKRDALSKKFNELRQKKVPKQDLRWKSAYDEEKRLNKLQLELTAKEKNAELFTVNKLTNLIKKITDLQTLKTHTTGIRGYHSIGEGSFTVSKETNDLFRVSFYRNKDKQEVVKSNLIDMGFEVDEMGGDLSVSVYKYNNIK